MSRRSRAVTLAASVLVILAVAAGPAGAGGLSPHPFDPLDLPDVTRIDAKARAGERPRFTWPAVDEASEYTLVVQDQRGRPSWAWRGGETAVFLGGLTELPEDAVGPVLGRRAQWQVIAYGADGSIVGASPWRVVSPR